MAEINWDFRAHGRAWSREEVRNRYALAPEKIELIEGKLFGTEEDRLNMSGLLLENIGIDKAVRLGNPEIWRQAISELEEPL
jgi:hypothetical protein